jgi:hypothetical protein
MIVGEMLGIDSSVRNGNGVMRFNKSEREKNVDALCGS